MFIQQAYAGSEINSDDDQITSTGITTPSENMLPQKPEPVESTWTSLVPLVMVFGVIYFFLIRPQEKRRKQVESVVRSVKKGEEIMTNSGLFGVVRNVNDDDNTVELEIAKDVVIKILKESIMSIVNKDKEAAAEKKNTASQKNKGKGSAKTS